MSGIVSVQEDMNIDNRKIRITGYNFIRMFEKFNVFNEPGLIK